MYISCVFSFRYQLRASHEKIDDMAAHVKLTESIQRRRKCKKGFSFENYSELCSEPLEARVAAGLNFCKCQIFFKDGTYL